MRVLISLFSFFLISISFAQNLPNGVSSNALVGLWLFNGDTQDQSVNSYDVTVNSASLTTDRFGNLNSAYEFNNSYMAVQDADPILSMNDNYTISMWFRSNDIYQNTQCLLNTSPHNYISLNFNHSSIADESMVIYTGAGSWTTIDNVIVGGDYNGTGMNSSNNALEGLFNTYDSDVWYHYVLVKNGDDYKTFANGCLDMHYIDSGAGGGPVGIIFGAIGNQYPSMGEFFNGSIDDVGIWQRALSEEEIIALSESFIECTDPEACNYTESTNICSSSILNGDCIYADLGYDCDGFCLNDSDLDGICNDDEILGCTDTTACNYDIFANTDDGSCYNNDLGCGCDLPAANQGFDCDGNPYSCGDSFDSMNGPYNFNGNNYYLSTASYSWLESYNISQNYGFYLTSINSQEEQDYLYSLILTSNLSYWIGLYQNGSSPDYSEPDGGWEWITTEPYNYNYWSESSPDNINSGDNYGFLNNLDGQWFWDDTSISENYFFIIECGSLFQISGCIDSLACNYNPEATIDDDSCIYIAEGFCDCDNNVVDCNGDCNGFASIDGCGDCTGGNTGLTSCIQDCNGEFGGDATLSCGVCDTIITNFSSSEVLCNGECSGSASFNFDDNNDLISFDLFSIDGTFLQQNESGIFNGLCSGCYSVSIYSFGENNGDCLTLDFCINESFPEISLTEIIPFGCNDSGSASFSLSTTSLNYSVDLFLNNIIPVSSDFNINSDNILFENLEPASYNVVLTDDSGCSDSYNFIIDNISNDIEIIDLDVISPLCWTGNSNISIDISASYNPDPSISFGELLIAEDLNSDCILNGNESFSFLGIIDNNFDVLNYSSQWNDTGDFILMITDNYGCSIETCFSSFIPSEPNPNTFFSYVDALCEGASGSAYVSGNPEDMGGTPFLVEPYFLVSWYDSFGNPVTSISDDALTASSLSAGEYTVEIIDANDCLFVHSFSIEEPSSSLISGLSYFNSTCFNECSGEVIVQPFGGEGEYYNIVITPEGQQSLPSGVLVAGINDTYIVNNLCPGNYQIQVSDGVCPIVIDSFTIEEPQNIEWDIAIDPLPCNGDVVDWSDNGEINGNYYVSQGGTQPANLYWFNQGQNMSIGNELNPNNLGPGTYNLLSIDAAGCEVPVGNINIPLVPELQSDFNPFDSELWIYCEGDQTGIIAFNTYGGTPPNGPYTYLWSFNGQYIPEYDNLNIIENLPAGVYNISVNDVNNCGPILHEIIIEESTSISASYLVSNYNEYSISCNGASDGFISLNPEGGLLPDGSVQYIYTWTGIDLNNNIIDMSSQINNQNINDLIAGEYTYTVQLDIPDDEFLSSNCLFSETISISEPNNLNISLVSQGNVTCNNGSEGFLNINFNGGTGDYNYTWSGEDVNGNIIDMSNQLNNPNINNLTAGIYTVVLQDSNGCGPISDSFEIIQPDALEAPNLTFLPTTSPALCSVGNTNSGQVSININDINLFISGGNEPYNNPILNFNGQLQNSILLSDSIIFTDLVAGEYELIIEDAEGCSISTDITIEVVNSVPLDFDYFIVDANCGNNGSLFINSLVSNIQDVPPFNVVVSSVSNPSFLYEFEYTDNFNPFSNDWNNNNIPDFDPDIDGDGLLNEEDGDIDGDGVYNWQDSTIYGEELEDVDQDGFLNVDPDFNPGSFGWSLALYPGEYEVLITDAVGCESSVFATVYETVSNYDVSVNPGTCYFNIDNSCDALSNNGSLIIDPNSFDIATLYPYYIELDGVLDTMILDWGIDSLSGEYLDYIIPNLQAGTAYSLSVINANGCGYSNNNSYYEVPFISNMNVEIVGFCPECQETSNGGLAYEFIEFEDEVQSINGSLTTSYYNGNSNSVSVLYNENGFINCVADDTTLNLINSNSVDTILLNNIIEEDFYYVNEEFLSEIPIPNVLPYYHQDYINNIEGLNDVSIGGLSHGTYYISLIDEHGCQFNQEIDISNETCNDELGPDQWVNCLFIPSVFTPNGDGINDNWKIYNIDLYEPNINVKIFNRWGQMVYENKDDIYTDNPWDGLNFQGNAVEIATYYYVIEVDTDNDQKKYTGYVIVKR